MEVTMLLKKQLELFKDRKDCLRVVITNGGKNSKTLPRNKYKKYLYAPILDIYTDKIGVTTVVICRFLRRDTKYNGWYHLTIAKLYKIKRAEVLTTIEIVIFIIIFLCLILF